MRRVTLVCGPPCAGKSTLVVSRAGVGDVVLDQDDIARAQGSGREWLHSAPRARRANRVMRSGIHGVAGMVEGVAWVIRTLPSGHRRGLLAAQLRADEVLVVKPPIETVLRRAVHRPNPGKTASLVRQWYAQYSPRVGDVVIEG
jgi:hypothetical protein